MEELWKDIAGYEGVYQVSNLGNVKSCEHTIKVISNNQHTNYVCTKTISAKYIKPSKDKNGYLIVHLSHNGTCITYKVHRLVAQAFIENPNNKPCVNHLDCDRQNNCVDNLEWCTHSENSQYMTKLGRNKGGEVLKKISKEQRAIINQKLCKPVIATNLTTGEEFCFKSIKEAAQQLNLHHSNITTVLKGRYKRTGNYTFKYAEDPN